MESSNIQFLFSDPSSVTVIERIESLQTPDPSVQFDTWQGNKESSDIEVLEEFKQRKDKEDNITDVLLSEKVENLQTPDPLALFDTWQGNKESSDIEVLEEFQHGLMVQTGEKDNNMGVMLPRMHELRSEFDSRATSNSNRLFVIRSVTTLNERKMKKRGGRGLNLRFQPSVQRLKSANEIQKYFKCKISSVKAKWMPCNDAKCQEVICAGCTSFDKLRKFTSCYMCGGIYIGNRHDWRRCRVCYMWRCNMCSDKGSCRCIIRDAMTLHHFAFLYGRR